MPYSVVIPDYINILTACRFLTDCLCRKLKLNPKLDTYKKYLQDFYKALSPRFSEQLSTALSIRSSRPIRPVPTTKVFELAMIQKEVMQWGKADDKLIRLSIAGKVDVILEQKPQVQLENLFIECSSNRRFVLIEGAPGSGKSTLALNICQEWAKGKLFQEYDLVVLVRLRETLVREAKTVADLLPRVNIMNKSLADEIGPILESIFDRAVLWVLDGWDELPSDLLPDSIITKLIRPENNPLIESSVIVTSRPLLSDQLRSVVSSRVEVLGFTQRVLEEYFKECLNGNSEAVQTLLERIQENPEVESSCYLPLNAAIVAHVFLASNHSLPSTNHEIFTLVIRFILSLCLQDRLGIPLENATIITLEKLPSKIKNKFAQICELAYFGIVKNKVTFDSFDFKVNNISITKVRDIGLLQTVPSILADTSEESYNFLHLSIQEMLAAFHISYLSPPKQMSIFNEHFGTLRFIPVFRFYAGITKFKKLQPKHRATARFVTANLPLGLQNLVSKIVQNKDKHLLVSLLGCLYEAEDKLLCGSVLETCCRKINPNEINFSNILLTPFDCLAVGYFLSVVSTTTSQRCRVNFSSCSIGDRGCKLLVKGLCKCLDHGSRITSKLDINLANNNIHNEGMQRLTYLLRNTSVIVSLDLTKNPIGDDGLHTICDVLSATDSTLEELHMSCCELTINERNGHSLHQLLANNTSLSFLSLSGNRVTDCCRIADGLLNNRTLTILQMSDCNLTNEKLEELSRGLNNCINVLGFGGDNSITEDGLSMFTRCLTALTGLRWLSIPAHLCSSKKLTALFSEINTMRKSSGLPKVEVAGKYDLLSKFHHNGDV